MKQLSPMETVRAHCTECLGLTQYDRTEIENCRGDTCIGGCALFPYRLGKRIPVKVFRKFCIECMNGQRSLIAKCPTKICNIFPYRFGKNPARSGVGRYRELGKTVQNSTIEPCPIAEYGDALNV